MVEGLDYGFNGVLAPAPRVLETPEVLGEYRLLRKLGEGGLAQVFLAEHLESSERVALKVLHPRFAGDPDRVRQLRMEAKALSQLGHENVVKIFAFREEPPFPHLVMEFLDGRPLTRLLGRPVDPQLAVPLLVQVCRALQAAHRRGVLHRDLKADNIFLVPRPGDVPLVKVLDFGLATPLHEGGASPGDGPVGTARYMAPEQWEGRPLDARTDLYALGVLAYGLATGRPPFTDRNEDDLRWAHCYRPAPDPRSQYAYVPDAWAAVIRKALEKDPAKRFQSAGEFAEALEAARDDAGPMLLGQPLPREEEEGPVLLGKLLSEAPEPAGEEARKPPEEPVVRPLFSPAVEDVLGRYRAVSDAEPYAVLGVAPSARTGEIWRSGGQRLSELSALAEARLTVEQREELARARGQVVKALCRLGLPHKRILHDAAASNLAGVARCIAVMGRTATEALRAAMAPPEKARRRARRYRQVAEARARRGERAGALEAYERALKQDPLDASLQRAYWTLKREVLRESTLGRGQA